MGGRACLRVKYAKRKVRQEKTPDPFGSFLFIPHSVANGVFSDKGKRHLRPWVLYNHRILKLELVF